jgi:hypothetical protein
LDDNPLAERVLKVSAADVVEMTAQIMATDTRQKWSIDPASSPAASYNFNGLSLVGWEVEHNCAGVTMNGAIFNGCWGATLNGGSLDGCTIENSQTSPAVETDDPGNISDCRFISAGSGHAIEITAAGTYNFSGNTFSGYGADDTTDAAIYNNSGGLVTLEIPAGGETPTILNGTDASTVIDTPALEVTLAANVSLVGAEVRIYDADTGSGDYKGDEIIGVESCLTAQYSFEVTVGQNLIIQIMKTGYVEYVLAYTAPATSTTLPITLEVDFNV